MMNSLLLAALLITGATSQANAKGWMSGLINRVKPQKNTSTMTQQILSSEFERSYTDGAGNYIVQFKNGTLFGRHDVYDVQGSQLWPKHREGLAEVSIFGPNGPESYYFDDSRVTSLEDGKVFNRLGVEQEKQF
ncbi:MAG: hypothetical protein V4736_03440, partial [Bdellovibrionota bacterium]